MSRGCVPRCRPRPVGSRPGPRAGTRCQIGCLCGRRKPSGDRAWRPRRRLTETWAAPTVSGGCCATSGTTTAPSSQTGSTRGSDRSALATKRSGRQRSSPGRARTTRSRPLSPPVGDLGLLAFSSRGLRERWLGEPIRRSPPGRVPGARTPWTSRPRAAGGGRCLSAACPRRPPRLALPSPRLPGGWSGGPRGAPLELGARSASGLSSSPGHNRWLGGTVPSRRSRREPPGRPPRGEAVARLGRGLVPSLSGDGAPGGWEGGRWGRRALAAVKEVRLPAARDLRRGEADEEHRRRRRGA